jgi:hypothetical protein
MTYSCSVPFKDTHNILVFFFSVPFLKMTVVYTGGVNSCCNDDDDDDYNVVLDDNFVS